VLQISSGEKIVLLVLGLVFAGLGYWLSESDRRKFGRTPWGLPSVVWALFWFLSVVLGLVLYLIAHSGVVRRARQYPGADPYGPGYGAGYGPGPVGMRSAPPPPSPPSVSDQFPAYPRPANRPLADPVDTAVEPPDRGVDPPTGHSAGVPPTDPSGSPMPSEPTDATAAVAAAAAGPEAASAPSSDVPSTSEAVSPPAWHPDPGGRFHYRWWDGSQWTSYVSINGQQLVDTNPDQRIGPY
jgi:Protein of unknown function (DUF2510)